VQRRKFQLPEGPGVFIVNEYANTAITGKPDNGLVFTARFVHLHLWPVVSAYPLISDHGHRLVKAEDAIQAL